MHGGVFTLVYLHFKHYSIFAARFWQIIDPSSHLGTMRAVLGSKLPQRLGKVYFQVWKKYQSVRALLALVTTKIGSSLYLHTIHIVNSTEYLYQAFPKQLM